MYIHAGMQFCLFAYIDIYKTQRTTHAKVDKITTTMAEIVLTASLLQKRMQQSTSQQAYLAN